MRTFETIQHTVLVRKISASPDLGTGRSVCGALVSVSVDRDTRVALRGIARDISKVVTAGRCRARSSNLNLSALSVELRVQRLVQSEQLVANKVVARGERLGDSGLPVQLLQNLGCAPGSAAERRCGHALLVDLDLSQRHSNNGGNG